MLIKTKGIVLRFVKYKESSVIATIYTEKEGLVSVIANSVRSKNSAGKIALFQPMSLVDLVLYFNHSKNISRVSEIKSTHPLHQLKQDPIKSTIAFFLTEVLNKCLKEEVGNQPLFTFIEKSIIDLDTRKDAFHNFHLIFLIKLSQYFGFRPVSTNDFIEQIANKSFYKDKKNLAKLEVLLTSDFEDVILLESTTRYTLLLDLLEYYQNHIELGKIKSIDILHELLHS
ncbi:MAG: DNA repair protein RecO [Cyclobacteriaceae bacterium]|nr:DNA repair protein RecO [Cyclobacteriaceae bacterium]